MSAVAGIINWKKAELLDSILGSGTPANVYITLSTTTPNPDGTGITEPTAEEYEPVQVANDGTGWEDATATNPAVKANKSAIQFAKAAEDWGTMQGWAIKAQETGTDPSNIIVAGHFVGDNPTIAKHVAYQFEAGELEVHFNTPVA